MSTLVINGPAFTQGKRTAERIASDQGIKVITDEDIIAHAMEKTGQSRASLEYAVLGKRGVFNSITREWERAVACLKWAVADKIEKGDCVFHGFAGLFVPPSMTHVSRILVVAEKPFRIIQAVTFHGMSEKEAMERIKLEDMNATVRSQSLFGKTPWDKSLYDLTIYADRIGENGPLEVIMKHMDKLHGISKEIVQKERADFKLTAEVELALSCCGGIGHVWVEQGRVVVTIKKGVIFQGRLKRKIMDIAGSVPGVVQVDVRFDQTGDSARTVSREGQTKQAPVLLVDDEKRYVETLSERLKIREVETKVTYSGEDALGYLDNQDTELMVLDLKMPGIDGFEVLRRIKATKPDVEVIILTGQGSEFDKKTCLDLGAFAFLERPVDIDVLTETMRKAHEKIRARKTNGSQENH